MNFRRSTLVPLAMLLVACASGGDDGVTPVSTAPTVKFTFSKLGVVYGAPVDLTVAVDDEDGDKLTVNWSITRGTLTEQNAGRTVMRWATPNTVGVDTVTITVSDGTHTRTIRPVVKVGWPAGAGGATLSNYQKIRSPYIVTLPEADPNLTVLAGTTTTVEPGTEFLFDTEGSTLRVLGLLEAHGTVDLPIVFRPNDRTFQCGEQRGWWEGFLGDTDDGVGTGGDIDFEYVEIWYAQNGVRLRSQASATLRDCTIRCSGDAGVLMEGFGRLAILDSQINNGRVDGVAIAAITSLPDSVHIEGCDIGINGNAGLRMDLKDLAQEVPIVVEYNKIEFNATTGISLGNSVFPRIHFNHFAGNGESSVSNIYLQSGYPGTVDVDTLDASCNFWGSVVGSQATIDVTIHDSLDAAGVGTRVWPRPWLNASPLTTTPACTPGGP